MLRLRRPILRTCSDRRKRRGANGWRWTGGGTRDKGDGGEERQRASGLRSASKTAAQDERERDGRSEETLAKDAKQRGKKWKPWVYMEIPLRLEPNDACVWTPNARERLLLQTSALETWAVKKKFAARTASSDSGAVLPPCRSVSRYNREVDVDEFGGCKVEARVCGIEERNRRRDSRKSG